MAKVYRQSDVSEADIFGAITQSAEKASEKIQLVDAQIVKFAEHSKALMNTADGKTIGGINQVIALNKDLQKQVAVTTRLEKEKIVHSKLSNEVASASVMLGKKEVQVNQQKASSIKKLSVEQAQLNEKQRQANAQTKAIAQLRNAEKGSLDALNAKMKLIEMAYNKLTPAQIENTKQGQRYLASLTAVRAELSKQQQAFGKHNLDVGNYKKAFDGLGFSVTQLTREMPAFANSIQTGFMAISNNLPMFFDEIQKIKQANVELKASGEPTKSVLKQVGGAVFSLQSLLSIGVTLLTVYGGKLIEWAMSANKAKKAGNEYLESIKKGNDEKKIATMQSKEHAEFISRESAEMVGMLLMLSKTNEGSKRRSKLISEINAKYGTTLKNMQNEALFQQQINAEVKRYIEYQTARYELEKNQTLIQKNLQRQDRLMQEILKSAGLTKKELKALDNVGFGKVLGELQAFRKEQQDIASESNMDKPFNDLTRSMEKTFSVLGETGVEIWRLNSQEVVNLIDELDKTQKRLPNYGLGLLKATEASESFGYTTEQTTGSLKDQAKAWEAINTQLEALDKLKEYTDFAKEMSQLDFDITTTVNSQELEKVTQNLNKFVQEQKNIVANGGVLNTDLIDDYINYEYELRQRQILRTRDFKLQQLQEEFKIEKDLAYKAIDEETKELIKTAEEQRRELLSQENLTKSQALDIQNAYEKSIDEIGKSRLQKIDDLNEIYIDKEKLRNKQEQQIVVESNAEIEKTEQEHNQKIIDINEDLINTEIEQANKSNEEKAKLREQEEKAEKESQKRLAEFRKNMINEGLDQWKKASEEREKLIDREISASEKLADDLRQQANNGTIQANQSLAEQERITNEKIQQKQKEQRIQQQIEEIKLLYNATEQYLQAGDTLPVAGSKAFLQVKGIKLLAQSLTGFFKGTKRTIGEELGAPQLSGKDGHIVRVDGSEMVFNGDLTNKVMSVNPSATTDEIVDTYVKSKTSNKAPVFIQNSTADERLIKEVQDLKNVMKNKTEFTMHGESISNTLFQIVSTEKKGADLIKTRHIFKRNL